MMSLRVCIFLTVIGLLKAFELSPTMREFYCSVNGNYSDQNQVASDDYNHTLVTVKLQPVFAPKISPLPVVYFEDVDNGVVVRSEVFVLREGPNGVVYFRPYNISGNNVVKPDTFDPQVLKTINPDQLEGRADCEDVFTRIDPFVFFFEYLDCKLSPLKGHRESYDGTYSCSTLTFTPPIGEAENRAPTPYMLSLQGKKFPLENAPDNYVCDCDNPSG